MLADAEMLATSEVRMLGNWSLGQNFQHIATALHATFDGAGFMMSAPVRWVMSFLMKNKFLNKAIPAGFKAPEIQIPAETSTEDGLAALHEAVARQKQDEPRAMHPGFGKITAEEWDQFNLRHAELHLSFAVPVES